MGLLNLSDTTGNESDSSYLCMNEISKRVEGASKTKYQSVKCKQSMWHSCHRRSGRPVAATWNQCPLPGKEQPKSCFTSKWAKMSMER